MMKYMVLLYVDVCFDKQKTAYEMRISDWSSDVCSSDLIASFLSALTILLREGLEALLIVVAMVAFLRKSERQDALPYVHGGWIAALVAGLLTWIVATRSEERRVGKEFVSTFSSRWSP